MNERLSVAIPCRANEPDFGVTLASLAVACRHALLPPGFVAELVICINGVSPGITGVPLGAVRDFCARSQVSLEERWLEAETHRTRGRNGERENGRTGEREKENVDVFPVSPPPVAPFPRCTVLLTERRGKPPAWNTLWQWAHGTFVLFADADVQVDSEAVYHLWARFQHEPHLQLVAAREVPVLKDGGTVWSRMGAIPYRFNFGNAGGRLLLLRKEALPGGMPEDLLLEDAWLTVAVGRHGVAKDMQARVFFLLPATGRDYFAERVRTEGGKLQIRRLHRDLLAAGPIAQYQWPEFWREIRMTEYPLVILALVVRVIAHLWARLSLTRKDFYALYRPFPSTKGWESPLR